MEKEYGITIECLLMSLLNGGNRLFLKRPQFDELLFSIKKNGEYGHIIQNLSFSGPSTHCGDIDDGIFNLKFMRIIFTYDIECIYYKTHKFKNVYNYMTSRLNPEQLDFLNKFPCMCKDVIGY